MRPSSFLGRPSTLIAAFALTVGCADAQIGDPSNPSATEPVPVTPRPTTPVAPKVENPWAGHWYLDAGNRRLTVTLTESGGAPASGTILDENAGTPASALANVQLDMARQELSLSEQRTDGSYVHYRLRARDGVVVGRFAASTSSTTPTDTTSFTSQVIGWRDETFSSGIVPRTFDILIGGHQRAVLRIDRPASGGGFVGRLKAYATDEVLAEQLSEDVEITNWDGQSLAFRRPAAPALDQYSGVVSGRTISGTMTNDNGITQTFSGTRAEVLSHGLSSRPAKATLDWQTRTRQRLAWLTMASNPAPLSLQATSIGHYSPLPATTVSTHRDDAIALWPASYLIDEMYLDATLPSPSGGAPLARRSHAVVGVPTTAAPPTGFPVAIVVNGHWGSAWRTFDPQNSLYWYGDSFARRGFVVIAVDVGHRPLGDRQSLYQDMTDGDDATAGNGTHPAIKDPGMDSEWEEDGERAWDVMRAMDYVLSRPDVDRQRVTVAGLSLGGEVTEWVGAMDGRAQTVVVASAPADFSVARYHGNHPCWGWVRGNAREFFDPSDLDALAAPRTLVRETGRIDGTFSSLPTPFAGDKQSVRRVQPVFDALGGRLIHYLHYDAHIFHVGELAAIDQSGALGVTIPMIANVTADQPWSTLWQTDQSTEELTSSLYDEISWR